MKPLLLDFYCSAGGVAKGLQRAGFRVIGIDIKSQPRYCGDGFVRGDALELLQLLLKGGGIAGYTLEDFVGAHASPPCQFYAGQGGGGHWRSIPPTRELLEATGLPYVIENVSRARWDMREPLMLCGSSFGLGVERHRLFECTFPVMALPCAHGQQEKRYRVFQRGEWYMSRVAHVWGSGGGKAREQWGEAMGIDWMTDRELKEAIPPAMTEHIGHYLKAHLEALSREAA